MKHMWPRFKALARFLAKPNQNPADDAQGQQFWWEMMSYSCEVQDPRAGQLGAKVLLEVWTQVCANSILLLEEATTATDNWNTTK